MNKYYKASQDFVPKYLQRPWSAADGLPEKEIKKAEARLGVTLPPPLRNFYLAAGRVTDLCSSHNVIFPPKDLDFEDGYLMFMEENQSVVSWGIKKQDLKKTDPEVWQRNNQSDKWYSEKKGLIKLLASMFDFYQQIGVWMIEPKKR